MTRFAPPLLGLLIALIAAPFALGQSELPWRLRDEPRITRAELEEFLEEQELEASDAAIILRSAHEDLLAEYADLARERAAERAHVQQLQNEWYAANPPQPGIPRMQPRFSDPVFDQALRDRRARIERDFDETVLALLPESQFPAWQRIVNARKRTHTLEELRMTVPDPSVGNPYLDLFQIVEDANLASEDSAIAAPLLDQYGAAMAAAIDDLLAREDALNTVIVQNQFADLAEAQSPEGKAKNQRRQAAVIELIALRNAIVAVNDRFRPQIESALSPAGLRKFQRAIKQQMFPSIYLADPVELAVDGLREWSGLPTNLRSEMEVIWEDYEAQREAILDRLIDAHQRWEAPGNADVRREYDQKISEIMRARQEGRPIDDIEPEETPPFTFEPLQQRHELAMTTLRRLSGLFSADQRATLPAHVRLCLDLVNPS